MWELSPAPYEPPPRSAAAPSAPAPSPLPHHTAEQELHDAYEALPAGAIAYPERMTMRQGSSSPVTVRLGLTPKLSTDGIGGDAIVEPAKLSRFVVACLVSTPGQFQLLGTQGQPTDSSVCRDSGCSCLRQTLVGEAADVSWSVTPLESGDLKLYLRVAAQLFLSGSREEAHDVLSKEGVVHVESDVLYVASGFVQNSWREMLASIGGVGALWAFGKRLLARKEAARQAGFGRGERPSSPSWVRKALKSIRP